MTTANPETSRPAPRRHVVGLLQSARTAVAAAARTRSTGR